MLRTVNGQPTLWEAVIPECLLPLPGDLARVDVWLDDPRFFEPFRPVFDPTHGRPSIPMETYLRLMYLRFRYRLGFEALCVEVADSLAWRRFCRVPLGERVPHPTTLMKITTRCGEAAIGQLNEVLLAKAHEEKLVRLDRVRADTTVVEANVAYPTDSGLLAKGVAKMGVLVATLAALGLATRTRFVDRTRSVRRRAHDIGAWLRRRNEDAKEEVQALNLELCDIATKTIVEARRVAVNARRGVRDCEAKATGKALRAIAELERCAGLVEQIAAQTRLRASGVTPDGSTRVVSLHDPDARPIAKGRLGRPVEFGYKAQVVDNQDGLVLDHGVVIGNPPDAPMLAPAIARIIRRFGKAPRIVTADRGYGEATVEADLKALKVRQVAIPRKGRPGAARQHVQRAAWFQREVKWRTGSEARINCLKRDNGWRRTLLDSEVGARTWCGWGVLAHNTTKLARLQAEAERQSEPPTPPAGQHPEKVAA